MNSLLDWLLESNGYMPHGHCYLWQPPVLWLHVGANLLIAASYFAIPLILYAFLRRRRREIPYWGIPALFAAFIFLCGTTHAFGIWTIWNPDYRLDGLIKLLTGLVSATTAVALAWIMPKAMALQTPAQLQATVDQRTAALTDANRRLESAIEAQRRTAQALRDSERRYRLAIQALRGFVYELDPRTGRSSVSDGFEKVYGVPLVGDAPPEHWWREHVHPDDQATCHRAWSEAEAAGEDAVSCRYRVRTPDGREVWLWDHALFVRGADGRVERVYGNVVDITEQERARQELEAADRRKDRFLATLAHELRNPLAPIRFGLRLLEPGTPDESAARARQMIGRQVGLMARLLDDLLDVSRVSRGRLELRREILDLREVVAMAVETARPLLEAVRHEVALALPETAVTVYGDPTRLAQLLGNLLNNAGKYSDPGSRIAVSLTVEGGRALVRVRDSGIGIAPETLERIFEMFAQVDDSPRAQSGLGIGLALARQLATLHGGSLDARSEGLGRGSEFTLALPLGGEVAAVEPPAGAPDRASGAGSRRVLIVGARVDAAEALAVALGREGYVARTAHDPPAAIEVAELMRPGVVLVALSLGDEAAHSLARWIRAQPWGLRAVLIAIADARGTPGTPWHREVGFTAFLTEPLESKRLLECLERSRPGATEN